MSVWDSLRGSRAAEWLEGRIAAGEIAHAWLLIGPAGSGKRPAAVAIAAALNCTNSPNVGCGGCASCSRVIRRQHPDVHHIVPEGPLIPVDVIRESVLPEAARSPFEGSYKVFIIEEADRMNDSAQNALLKTLEDPHPDTVFILISDHEEELLDTIHSRCRAVRLESVPEERIVELLRAEGVAEPDALLAARVSEGDLERARILAADGPARRRRDLWLGIPARLVSAVDALDAAAEILAEAKEAVKAREALQKIEVTELAEAMGEGRGTGAARTALTKRHRRELRRVEEEVLGEALYCLASFYRDALAVRRSGMDAVANIDVVADLEAWAQTGVDDAAFVAAVERLIDARASLAKNANVPLAIESALLEAARLIGAPAGAAATIW